MKLDLLKQLDRSLLRVFAVGLLAGLAISTVTRLADGPGWLSKLAGGAALISFLYIFASGLVFIVYRIGRGQLTTVERSAFKRTGWVILGLLVPAAVLALAVAILAISS